MRVERSLPNELRRDCILREIVLTRLRLFYERSGLFPDKSEISEVVYEREAFTLGNFI